MVNAGLGAGFQLVVSDRYHQEQRLYTGAQNEQYAEAIKPCRKDAEDGDLDAQVNLVVLYFYGHGTDIGYVKAPK